MRPHKKLPEGYEKKLTIDMQKDKKTSLTINLAALILGILTVLLVLPFKSLSMLFDTSSGYVIYFLRFAVIIAGSVVYIILHEFIHGYFIRLFTGERATYGFTGAYAYAGSPWFFDKKSYLIIALSPVIIWGLVLSVICVIVPRDFFWSAYLIQALNISGAAGDLFITFKMLRLPPDILIQDSGTAMTVFARNQTDSEM